MHGSKNRFEANSKENDNTSKDVGDVEEEEESGNPPKDVGEVEEEEEILLLEDSIEEEDWENKAFWSDVLIPFYLGRVVGNCLEKGTGYMKFMTKTPHPIRVLWEKHSIGHYGENVVGEEDVPSFCFAKHNTLNVVYVIVRGSTTFDDWVANCSVYSSSLAFGEVHGGFLKRSKKIPIDPIITLLKCGYKVILSGFSQGSAVAQLTMVHLLHELERSNRYLIGRVKFIGIAGPLVGDEKFAAYMNQKKTDGVKWSNFFHHFILKGDAVPAILHRVGNMPHLQYGSGEGCRFMKEIFPFLAECVSCPGVVVGGRFLKKAAKKIPDIIRHASPSFTAFGTYYVMDPEDVGRPIITLDGSQMKEVLEKTELVSFKSVHLHSPEGYKNFFHGDNFASTFNDYTGIKKTIKATKNFVGDLSSSFGSYMMEYSKTMVDMGAPGVVFGTVLSPFAAFGMGFVSTLDSAVRLHDRHVGDIVVQSMNSIIQPMFSGFRGTYNHFNRTIRIVIFGANLNLVKRVRLDEPALRKRMKAELVDDGHMVVTIKGVEKVADEISLSFVYLLDEFETSATKVKISSNTINDLPLWVLFQNGLFQSLLLSSKKFSDDSPSRSDDQKKTKEDTSGAEIKAAQIMRLLMDLEKVAQGGISVLLNLLNESRKTYTSDLLEKSIEGCAIVCAYVFSNGLTIKEQVWKAIISDPVQFILDPSAYQQTVAEKKKKIHLNVIVKKYMDGKGSVFLNEKDEQEKYDLREFKTLRLLFQRWRKVKFSDRPDLVTRFFYLGMLALFKFSITHNAIRIPKVNRIERFVFLRVLEWMRVLDMYECLTVGGTLYFENVRSLCNNIMELDIASNNLIDFEMAVYTSFRRKRINFLSGSWKKELIELYPKMREVEKDGKTDAVATFYRFVINVCRLRRLLSESSMVMICGTQKVGKSCLLEKLWDFKSESEKQKEDGRHNTRDPKIYQLSAPSSGLELYVVDIRAFDDKDLRQNCMQRVAFHSSMGLVVMFDHTNSNSAASIGLQRLIVSNIDVPYVVFLNKTDKLFQDVLTTAVRLYKRKKDLKKKKESEYDMLEKEIKRKGGNVDVEKLIRDMFMKRIFQIRSELCGDVRSLRQQDLFMTCLDLDIPTNQKKGNDHYRRGEDVFKENFYSQAEEDTSKRPFLRNGARVCFGCKGIVAALVRMILRSVNNREISLRKEVSDTYTVHQILEEVMAQKKGEDEEENPL